MTFGPLTRSPLAAVVFYELIRFNAPDPGGVRRAGAPRSIDALVADRPRARQPGRARAVLGRAAGVARDPRSAIDRDPFAPCSVHLSESAEEVEFIRTGGGPWRALLEERGVVGSGVDRRRAVSPVQFLDESGFLDARVLAVHGVQMTPADLERLAARGATLVTCPRSNGHTGAGAPPIEDFYASGVRVAVGTDSLASAPDLNVFAELATLRALAPSVPAATLLDSATRQGARALGFDADYGTIEPGKRARLLAVDDSGADRRCGRISGVGIEPEQIAGWRYRQIADCRLPDLQSIAIAICDRLQC